MRAAVALLLLFAFGTRAAAVEQSAPSAYIAEVPAPANYAPLLWRHAGEPDADGFWFSALTVRRASARIDYLENKAAKECFDNVVAADKPILSGKTPFWIGVAAGVILGAFGGWYLGRKL